MNAAAGSVATCLIHELFNGVMALRIFDVLRFFGLSFELF
jgi:hypothetical protein